MGKSFVALLRRHLVIRRIPPSIIPESKYVGFAPLFLIEIPNGDSVDPKLFLSGSSQFSPNILYDALV